jgi:Flp pilus assembly protein TadG
MVMLRILRQYSVQGCCPFGRDKLDRFGGRHVLYRRRRGQTLTEFAFILPIALLLMLGVIQIIVVGGAALAVNQAAVACARYASLNPTADQSAVNTYLKNIASPLINDAKLQNVTLQPTATPRQTGTAISVTITYNLANKLFLGSSFFGVTFPTSVSVTQTMPSE